VSCAGVGLYIRADTYGFRPYQPYLPLLNFRRKFPFFWSGSTLLEKALKEKILSKFLVKLFQSLMRQGFLL